MNLSPKNFPKENQKNEKIRRDDTCQQSIRFRKSMPFLLFFAFQSPFNLLLPGFLSLLYSCASLLEFLIASSTEQLAFIIVCH